MSAIDKTYVKKSEYLLAREFWLSTREKQIKELGRPIYLYSFVEYDVDPDKITLEHLETKKDIDFFVNDVTEFPLWNTSLTEDLWLLKNCKLDFVQKRLREQHGSDWYGITYVDDIDFTEKPCFIQITKKKKGFYADSNIYFFTNSDNLSSKDFELNLIDKILVYGTTDFFKFFNYTKNIILYSREKDPNLEVSFYYYGLLIDYRDDKFFINEKEISFKLSNFDDWEIPKIKYSFNVSDADDYNAHEIYFSAEDIVYPLTDFIDYDTKQIKRYIFHLPAYIRNLIV
jgi:hypothetical protein